MIRKQRTWTTAEDTYLIDHAATSTQAEIGLALDRTEKSVAHRVAILRARRGIGESEIRQVLPESGYPRYDKPLLMAGDAVIFPDLEIPFHHAEFVNRVLDLAAAWGIRQAILAGDALHLDSFSAFEKNWREARAGGLDEKQEKDMLEWVASLPEEHRRAGMERLEKIGLLKPDNDVSDELGEARKIFKLLAGCFDRIDWDPGNHEGRALRVMKSPLMPSELLVQVVQSENPKWRIAPYYYSYLDTGGGRYQIEHPTSAAESAPVALANKFECHVTMGHSHDWSMRRSASGRYWAIAMGHCVDESRLPYAAQRHSARKAHCLGAVIVRDGFPHLLSQETPWLLYKRM